MATGGGTPSVIKLASPLNALAVAPDGEIVAAGADGKLRFLRTDGRKIGEVQAAQASIVALAISPDGTLIAASGISGIVTIIDRRRAASRERWTIQVRRYGRSLSCRTTQHC